MQMLPHPVVQCNNKGQILSGNAAWHKLTYRGRNLLKVVTQADVSTGVQLRRVLTGGANDSSCELKLGKSWYRLEVQRVSPECFSALFTDITDLKTQLLEAAHRAETDTLTGLPNRRRFFDVVETTVPTLHRRGKTAALFMIDLDKFKWVNDTYGHDVGDKLLVLVAKRLRRALRPKDTLVRWGGDEFVAFLPNLLPEQVSSVQQRCMNSLAQPFRIGDLTLTMSASIGHACVPRDGTKLVQVLEYADHAMYKSKMYEERSASRLLADVGRGEAESLRLANLS